MINFKFVIALTAFMSWTVSQIIVPLKILPYNIQLMVEPYKTIIPVICICICCLMYCNKFKFNNTFNLFSLFGVYTLINSLIHIFLVDGALVFNVDVSLMYLIWSVCIFLLCPAIFDTKYKVKLFLTCSLITIVSLFLISTIITIRSGADISAIYSVAGLRYNMGYNNPLYLGGICFSVICVSLMLMPLIKKKSIKIVIIIIIAFFASIIFLALARTFLVGTASLFILYFWLTGPRQKKYSVLLTALCLIFISYKGYNVLMTADIYNTFDRTTSGRITLWKNTIENLMYDGFEWKAVFGNGVINQSTTYYAWDGGEIGRTFTRFHIDNKYLEIFIMQGSIGLIIFLLGLWSIFQYVPKMNKINRIQKLTPLGGLLSAGYASMFAVITGAIFYSHFPSIGNTINSAVLPAVFSIINISRNKMRTGNKIL